MLVVAKVVVVVKTMVEVVGQFLFIVVSLLKLTCMLATERRGMASGESLASQGEAVGVPHGHLHQQHGVHRRLVNVKNTL